MKRQALSMIAVLSLLISTLSFLVVTDVQACGGREPVTLLWLYQKSDTIHIGRFRAQEEGEPKKEGEDADYSIAEVKKHFDISSTLKGKPVKTLTLFDERYIYHDPKPEEFQGFATIAEAEAANKLPETQTESEPDSDEESEEVEVELDDDGTAELKPGDHVILFLSPDEDNDNRPQLTEYADGIKNLPPADIGVYEARIKELNTIFAKEKPSNEAIVDWLVRCAEDKATRWEGTYELSRSFFALEYKQQRESERKTKIAAGEAVEQEDDYYTDKLEPGRTTIFANTINEHQKQTLVNVLLNSEFRIGSNGDMTPGFARGDQELLELVTRWANSQIAAILVERLRSGAFTAYENLQMMDAIAKILDDERLSNLAAKYNDVAYNNDEAVVDAEDLESLKDEDTTGAPERGDEQVDEPRVAPVDGPRLAPVNESVKPAPAKEQPIEKKDDTPEKALPEKAKETVKNSEDEAPKAPKLTYERFRSELVQKFLTRADLVIADPQGHLASKAEAAAAK